MERQTAWQMSRKILFDMEAFEHALDALSTMNHWIGKEEQLANEKSLGEVLEAAEELSLEDQEELMNVLLRRIAERRRDLIARDIHSARGQFRKGSCRSLTPDELMTEILS